jgi:WD40 repeat protein
MKNLKIYMTVLLFVSVGAMVQAQQSEFQGIWIGGYTGLLTGDGSGYRLEITGNKWQLFEDKTKKIEGGGTARFSAGRAELVYADGSVAWDFKLLAPGLIEHNGTPNILSWEIYRFRLQQNAPSQNNATPQVGHLGPVISVAFSPDGKYILSCSYDKTIKLWDIATGRESRTFSDTTIVDSVAFSPDGKYILSCSDDNTIKLWDIATGREIRTFSGYYGSFSPDGTQIFTIDNGGLKLLDIITGREIRRFDDVVSLDSLSPDGRQIIAGSAGKPIKLLDVSTGREIWTFSGLLFGGYSTKIAFSPDGRQIVAGSAGKPIKLLDVSTGREIWTSDSPVEEYVAFSPDGRQIVAGSWNTKPIKLLLDVSTGREIWTSDSSVRGYVAFSPDGRQLVGVSSTTIVIIDATTGKEIKTFSGHRGGVISVCFSPDGKYILSGSYDTSIKLWDTVTGRVIRTIGTEREGMIER